MKFQLGKTASDIFVLGYLLTTLFVRIVIEPQIAGHYLVSMGLGAFALLFLWALWKSRVINPSWFGLFKPEKE